MSTLAQLAREGHGAIQVDLPDEEPVKVVLVGPIKHWWSLSDDEWGTGEHATYIEWRDAVEAACVKAGFLVYCAHKAWRGAWSDAAQRVNDAAIEIADVLVDLTPAGIPNEGTLAEIEHAQRHGIVIVHLPPSSIDDIDDHIPHLGMMAMPKVSQCP